MGKANKSTNIRESLAEIARSSPEPKVPRNKCLSETYPMLRCEMGWGLKSKLDFLSRLHGVKLSYLVERLIDASIEDLERSSRKREEFKEEWATFDAAVASAKARIKERRHSGWGFSLDEEPAS
jgi:predicted DNA-binding protein